MTEVQFFGRIYIVFTILTISIGIGYLLIKK